MIRDHGCKPGRRDQSGDARFDAFRSSWECGPRIGDVGKSGLWRAKFIPGALEKIRQLKLTRERYNLAFRIEVDGGVGPENVADLVRSGAEILVAGTSIFHTPDPAEAVRAMKQMAGGALAQRA